MRHLIALHYLDAIVRAGSIRKAAESLSITSTALNRRILSMEQELGAPIFERLSRGVRLSAAGEILIHHARAQIADMERVKSQISDLSGVRRGHVSIACSQAVLPVFLPEQIARYRSRHPAVTFSVLRRDREAAEQALVDHSADLALVFEPIRFSEFGTLLTVSQPIHVLMSKGHPLSKSPTVRLRDCLRFPIAMPTHLYGVRSVLDKAVIRTSVKLRPVIETDSFEFLRHYAKQEKAVSFQIPIGISAGRRGSDDVSRPIDPRDVPPGMLYLGQLRGRTLPVAANRFAEQLASALTAMFEDVQTG